MKYLADTGAEHSERYSYDKERRPNLIADHLQWDIVASWPTSTRRTAGYTGKVPYSVARLTLSPTVRHRASLRTGTCTSMTIRSRPLILIPPSTARHRARNVFTMHSSLQRNESYVRPIRTYGNLYARSMRSPTLDRSRETGSPMWNRNSLKGKRRSGEVGFILFTYSRIQTSGETTTSRPG